MDSDYDSEQAFDMLGLYDDGKKPVPKEFLESLPLQVYSEANKQNFSEENKMCTICQCNYEVGEKFIIVPCLHRFHKDCVCKWFEEKNTCPVCKAEVCEVEQPEDDEQHEESGFHELSDRHILQEDHAEFRLPPSHPPREELMRRISINIR